MDECVCVCVCLFKDEVAVCHHDCSTNYLPPSSLSLPPSLWFLLLFYELPGPPRPPHNIIKYILNTTAPSPPSVSVRVISSVHLSAFIHVFISFNVAFCDCHYRIIWTLPTRTAAVCPSAPMCNVKIQILMEMFSNGMHDPGQWRDRGVVFCHLHK